ncbi:38K [Chrysodeixis includens nucleopolyhedrovirus]|uniref:38K n=1 Tax=Chrysodeixis includens nucleopolyhedrovirus TaxID=1207438 RepID=A0A1C8ZX44_9ABAC|nr:38K [Chrysodeixis includens nucleopolyhedrovirus]AOL56667.1 38K [Chrysodeixis includens nucleopolyhedrovirus]AOL56808.1 38K [Chrysodeixis includens nucleopolyhedrovirus]AOL56950.1 38K [Chrysodeixis includens nucleopolyhedrovirus]AOL57092.1 38K [Chrysodeixis includens nucleopolyhedrovirus]
MAPPTWVVLRRRAALVKRHILVVCDFGDLSLMSFRHLDLFEFVVFALDKKSFNARLIDTENYIMQLVRCEDNMREIRVNLKLAYKTSALGHVYVINEKIPMYWFLKDWYVQNYLEVYQMQTDSFSWEIPHVLVFDLDNTLISGEEDVRIRHDDVYDSLIALKEKGFVLVLWSYGNKEHVTYSMDHTRLVPYFDVVICGGQRSSTPSSTMTTKRVLANNKTKHIFVEKAFYSDVNVNNDEDAKLPKSPRIVLYYLRKAGINYIKTISLIDDLKANDYSFDYFIKVRKCIEPLNDWDIYHDEIVDNIDEYESWFRSNSII